MEEEEKEQANEQGKEGKTPASHAGKPNLKQKETLDLIQQANSTADRLEKQNKQYEALIERQEKLTVENTLGGSTDAGQNKEQTDDEKADEAARKQLKGTGYEDLLFPEKKE